MIAYFSGFRMIGFVKLKLENIENKRMLIHNKDKGSKGLKERYILQLNFESTSATGGGMKKFCEISAMR